VLFDIEILLQKIHTLGLISLIQNLKVKKAGLFAVIENIEELKVLSSIRKLEKIKILLEFSHIFISIN
jgi:endonuclease IV